MNIEQGILNVKVNKLRLHAFLAGVSFIIHHSLFIIRYSINRNSSPPMLFPHLISEQVENPDLSKNKRFTILEVLLIL